MQEIIIPLNWEHLNDLLEYIDDRLTRSGFPTILKMRAQMLVEELFQALMQTDDVDRTKVRCTQPNQKTILLQYRSPNGAVAPDVSMIEMLIGAGIAYGVKAQFAEASCTLTIGEK